VIYSRFGTPLTPLSKHQDASGRISIQASAKGMEGVRDYALAELTADEGMPEIDAAAAKLPWRVIEKKTPPRSRRVR
jgi:hypothetical protein